MSQAQVNIKPFDSVVEVFTPPTSPAHKTTSSQLYTTKDIIKRLNISQQLLYKLIKEGKLNYVRIGTQYRFTEDSVNDLLGINHIDTQRLIPSTDIELTELTPQLTLVELTDKLKSILDTSKAVVIQLRATQYISLDEIPQGLVDIVQNTLPLVSIQVAAHFYKVSPAVIRAAATAPGSPIHIYKINKIQYLNINEVKQHLNAELSNPLHYSNRHRGQIYYQNKTEPVRHDNGLILIDTTGKDTIFTTSPEVITPERMKEYNGKFINYVDDNNEQVLLIPFYDEQLMPFVENAYVTIKLIVRCLRAVRISLTDHLRANTDIRKIHFKSAIWCNVMDINNYFDKLFSTRSTVGIPAPRSLTYITYPDMEYLTLLQDKYKWICYPPLKK